MIVAVFGVHGAGGVIVQRLYTADRAHLHASSPTALSTRLPFTGDPPARAEREVVREPVWLWLRWAVRTERSALSCLQLKLFLASQKHLPCVQACVKGKLRLRYSPACQSRRGSAGASGLKGLPPVYLHRVLGLITVSSSDGVMNPP